MHHRWIVVGFILSIGSFSMCTPPTQNDSEKKSESLSAEAYIEFSSERRAEKKSSEQHSIHDETAHVREKPNEPAASQDASIEDSTEPFSENTRDRIPEVVHDSGTEQSHDVLPERVPEIVPEGCSSGKTACGGVCIDTQIDPQHCGACGRSCKKGLICEKGRCVLSKASKQAIDAKMMAEFNKQALVGLAVGVLMHNQIVYLQGYGDANREHKVPVVAEKTMFRWASISKSVAGVLAARLTIQKHLNVDADIRTYIPLFPEPKEYVVACSQPTIQVGGKTYPCVQKRARIPLPVGSRRITSRWLLGHLGGISHYSNGLGNPSPPTSSTRDPNINTGIEWAVRKYLYAKPLVAPPGTAFHYTTFGFNLLGVVLEKAGKAPFATQVKNAIATPAQMHTFQPDYEWVSIPNRAVGYTRRGTSILRQGSDDVSWKLPGGGYISTVKDLALYCKALQGQTIWSSATQALAWTPQKTTKGKIQGYGFGFGIGRRASRLFVGHSASQQKTQTQLRLYPKEGLCVVVMTNSTYAKTATIRDALEDVVRTF